MFGKYQLDKKYIEPVQYQMEYVFQESNKDNATTEKELRTRLTELNQKIEKLEEKFFLSEEMDKATFDRIIGKLKDEKRVLLSQLEQVSNFTISNLSDYIKTSLQVASNLSSTWASGSFSVKENLQKLVFPGGIVYDKENEGFRTEKVNSIFSLIAELVRDSGENKKGQKSKKTQLSLCADATGERSNQLIDNIFTVKQLLLS